MNVNNFKDGQNQKKANSGGRRGKRTRTPDKQQGQRQAGRQVKSQTDATCQLSSEESMTQILVPRLREVDEACGRGHEISSKGNGKQGAVKSRKGDGRNMPVPIRGERLQNQGQCLWCDINTAFESDMSKGFAHVFHVFGSHGPSRRTVASQVHQVTRIAATPNSCHQSSRTRRQKNTCGRSKMRNLIKKGWKQLPVDGTVMVMMTQLLQKESSGRTHNTWRNVWWRYVKIHRSTKVP